MMEATDTRDGGGETGWSGRGDGEEWTEVVSVEVLRGEGEREFEGLMGGRLKKEGEDETGRGNGRVYGVGAERRGAEFFCMRQ